MIYYQDGKVRLENVTAGHGQTSISTEGSCDFAADGGFRLTLTNVALLFQPAPEPASIALFATGLVGLTAVRRRFFHRAQR